MYRKCISKLLATLYRSHGGSNFSYVNATILGERRKGVMRSQLKQKEEEEEVEFRVEKKPGKKPLHISS